MMHSFPELTRPPSKGGKISSGVFVWFERTALDDPHALEPSVAGSSRRADAWSDPLLFVVAGRSLVIARGSSL